MPDIETAVLAAEQSRLHHAESTAALKKTLIKLACFMGLLVLGSLFFNKFMVWLFKQFGAASLPKDELYLVNWILNDICAYFLPASGLLILFRGELRDKVACIKYEGRKTVLETVLCFGAMIFTGSVATRITDAIAAVMDLLFGTGEIQDALGSVAPQNYVNFTVFFLFVCLIGPVCEEIIFRYLLLKPLRRCGDGVAVLLSAFIFGVYHGNFDQFPYAFAVGIFFGLIAVRTNSVLPSLILHVVNNTMVTMSSYLIDAMGENAFTTFVAGFIDIFYTLAYYGGIGALVLLITMKKFKFFNYCYPLLWGEKLSVAFRHPAAYIAIAYTVALFMV